MAGPWEADALAHSAGPATSPWQDDEIKSEGNEAYWRKKLQGQPSVSAAPPRGMGERFTDAFTNYAHDGIAGPISRAINANIQSKDAWNLDQDPRYKADPLVAAQADVRAKEADRRESYDLISTADPWNNDKLSTGQKIGAGVATLGGTVGGFMAGDGPLSLIGGGESIIPRMLIQGAVAGGSDAAGQGIDLANKQRDSYDLSQTGMAAGSGMLFQGALDVLGKAARGMRGTREPGVDPAAPAPTVRAQLAPEEADALTLHGIDVDTLEDVNAARVAAHKLMERNPPQPEAPPVIATQHGNIAPNADEIGRAPETRAANAGGERQAFEARVGAVEGTGKNPRSSAQGRFQFTDDTFVRQYEKRFGAKETRESILAKKKAGGPILDTLMRDLTNENEATLRRAGVPLTSGNYYLAHFAGAGGAIKLHASPDEAVEKVLGQRVVDANPFLAGMKARDVIAWADGKMGGDGPEFKAAGHAAEFVGPDIRRFDDNDSVYRAADHSNVESPDAYGFDPASAPQHMGRADVADTGNMGRAENVGAKQSQTGAELREPGARGDGMATGDMGRPFKAGTERGDGEFEGIQRERVKRAEAERETRWEHRRAEYERMKADYEARRNRAGQFDASEKHQASAATEPHYDAESGNFRTTDDGFVAGEDGHPVVFNSPKAAAAWAAKFKMGGDFELQAYGVSGRNADQRVTLQRKPGSTYGEQVRPHEQQAGDFTGDSAEPRQIAQGPWQADRVDTAAKAPEAVAKPTGSFREVRRDPDGNIHLEYRATPDAAPLPVKMGVDDGVAEMAIDQFGSGTNKLGPAKIREAMQQLQTMYPEIRSFGGYRRSGAGAGRVQEVAAPAPVAKASERFRPTEPMREPPKPRNFLKALEGELATRSKAAGENVRIDAQDAIDKGVPAEHIYHDPNARYPTIKANAAKVFSSSKAPLKSRAKPAKLVSMDDLGDRFDPRNFGIERFENGEVARPDPEEIGDLTRRSFEKDPEAMDRSDERYGGYQEWLHQWEEVDNFASRYGDNWRDLPDEVLDEIDAKYYEGVDRFYDEVLQGAERPEVDPFDPRFWDEDYAKPSAKEAGQSGAAEGGRDNLGGSERDQGQSHERKAGATADQREQVDAFGERDGDQRASLERKAEGRAKPKVAQKAPGSDGGLFDTRDTTGSLFGTFKQMLDDESGAFNPDAVAKFFVDTEKMSDAGKRMKEIASALKGSTARAVLAKTFDSMRMAGRPISAFYHSADARIRGLAARFDSDAIREIADMFEARAGAADGTGQTYHEAVEFNAKRWSRMLHDQLEPFMRDDAAMLRIRGLLTGDRPGGATGAEVTAAGEVRKLLKTIHTYRRNAGEDLGEIVDGYFPRMMNPELVVKSRDKFLRAAESEYVRAGETVAQAKIKAEAWFEQVMNEYGGVDGDLLDVRRARAPGTTTGLARKFDKQADKAFAEFYHTDPFDVLSAYVHGSAKRAEFTRRFGTKGREGSPERAAWEKDHGRSTQLDVLRDRIQKDILASGKEPGDALDLINTTLEANLGILGKTSRGVRTSISLAHAWNQVGKMDRSLITSLNELAMGAVRSGNFTDGLKFIGTTFKEFARALAKAEPSDARRYAEHLGMVLDASMDQTLQSRISAVEGSNAVNKVVSSFYRAIGLHQFTEATRVAAAKMAREHVAALTGDLASKSVRTVRRAERALAELGITDTKAFRDFMEPRGGKVRFDEIDADAGQAAKWSAAVYRMTNETVMNPTRAQKPLWANHPIGSLIYGLMSYAFSFKKKVMDRVGRKTVSGVKGLLGREDGDVRDLGNLLVGMPVLLGITYVNDTYLRPTLFGSNYDFENETDAAAALRVADRSSLLGALSPLSNVIFGQKYSRSLMEGFAGSVIGSLAQGAENMLVKPIRPSNSPNTNTAERNAAGALYDLTIEPAIDGALAGTVGGKVATLGIYMSGSRPGGLFPSDREAFIEALAGKKEEANSGDPFGPAPGSSDFDKAMGAGKDDEFTKAFSGK